MHVPYPARDSVKSVPFTLSSNVLNFISCIYIHMDLQLTFSRGGLRAMYSYRSPARSSNEFRPFCAAEKRVPGLIRIKKNINGIANGICADIFKRTL